MHSQQLTNEFETIYQRYDKDQRDFENKQLILYKKKKQLNKQIEGYKGKRNGVLFKKENDVYKVNLMLNTIKKKLIEICEARIKDPINIMKYLERVFEVNKSAVENIDKKYILEYEKRKHQKYKIKLAKKIEAEKKNNIISMTMKTENKIFKQLRLRKDQFRSFQKNSFDFAKFLEIKNLKEKREDKYFS